MGRRRQLATGRWRAARHGAKAERRTHGIIQANLAYTLTRHLRDAASPCRAVTEPAIVPRVSGARGDVRVPDVAVTSSQIDAGQLALPDPLLVVGVPVADQRTGDLGERLDLRVDPKHPGGCSRCSFGVDRGRSAAPAHGRHLSQRSRSQIRRDATLRAGVHRPDVPARRILHWHVSRARCVTWLATPSLCAGREGVGGRHKAGHDDEAMKPA